LDIALVILAAPLALVLLAAGAILVRLTMGAPVFFVQPRVGQEGRVFSMIKLRTMATPAAATGSVATVRGDPRITPCGRWLRLSHIDEIPQLLNVLAGHMSLVGPRPEQPLLAEAYTRQIAAFAFRQMVRPGITGWAQIRAGYAADAEETRVKLGYDLFYLKNFSFALDLQIIARTFVALVRARGAR
jgi:lipopolysaccharide/colanic/teichoic acid biosynthesis glycosyltransferase